MAGFNHFEPRSSLPGLTRQSIIFARSLPSGLTRGMDARVTSAFTRVFDALCPRMT
jgi:hypothetical protein